MNAAAPTPGEMLKTARDTQGLSAQKAADRLHLDAWVIEALENGDYARIGPSVYVKGHLKRYTELLGLPVGTVLEAYGSGSAPTLVASAAPTSTLRMRTTTPTGSQSLGTLLGGVGAAIVLIVGLYFWHPWQRRVAAPPPVKASAAKTAAANTDASPAADEPPASGVAEGTPTAQTSSAAPAASPEAGVAGPARLRLSFSADSWVDVRDAAGHRLFAGNGRANSVKTIAGDAPLKVYLGFVNGVQLQVNNRVVAVGSQFVAGDAAHFEAGADGVLRRDLHPAVTGNPHTRG